MIFEKYQMFKFEYINFVKTFLDIKNDNIISSLEHFLLSD